MLRARLFAFLRLLLVSAAFMVVVAPEWPVFRDERHLLNTIVGQRHFDFLVWETDALATKLEAALAGSHAYIGPETRRQLVLDYLEVAGEVQRLTNQINNLYADPNVVDPARESQALQEELEQMRTRLEKWQPLAEAIVQEQVATVLVEEGFGFLGHAWPPVQMHMTPLPLILVVSPRQEIRQIYSIPLRHGLSIADREDTELAVYETIDLSALVVPIGGLGLYPAMIVETSNVNFLADVTAHEWAHHWLSLHLLGLNYAASPELRTINETVASLVGTEIGAKVIGRFYPEFVPEPTAADSGPPSEEAQGPAPFDPDAELAKTRVRVDELLDQGRVDKAEAYMEQRRQFLWENGFRLRKLNQAYFAFYGAYADEPGEAGDDPIGPALLALRDDSPSLRDFMDRVAPVTSLEELLEVSAGLRSRTSEQEP